jgi:hypothetical protein
MVKPRTRSMFEPVIKTNAILDRQPMDESYHEHIEHQPSDIYNRVIIHPIERQFLRDLDSNERGDTSHSTKSTDHAPVLINPNSTVAIDQAKNLFITPYLQTSKNDQITNIPENNASMKGVEKKPLDENFKKTPFMLQKQLIHRELSNQSPEIKPILPQNNFQKQENNWLQQLKSAAEIYRQPVTPPTIKVNIGQLEVRTIVSTPAPTVKSSPPPKPRMSLEDFLNKQNRNAK